MAITDDPDLFAILQQEGKIVFFFTEMAVVRDSGLKPEQTAVFLTVKEVFGGILTHIGPPLGIDKNEYPREIWKKRAKKRANIS